MTPSMTTAQKTINPYNAYLVRQELTRWNAATNKYDVWTGATGSVTFAEDDQGTTPIAGLASFALSESGVAGTYYAEIPTASANLLVPYDGDTIYQIVTAGQNSDVTVVTPLRVVIPRWAQ